MPDPDLSKPLVMARFATVLGHNLNSGRLLSITPEPETAGQVDPDTAGLLFRRGIAVYAEDAVPTPVETPRQEALRVVTMEEAGGGWWIVNAPWLDEPEKVQGQDAAIDRWSALVDAGRPGAAEKPALALGNQLGDIATKPESDEGPIQAIVARPPPTEPPAYLDALSGHDGGE